MEFRLFDLNSDYEIIQSWASARNLEKVTKTRLSEYGLMVSVNGEDIAACFLFPFKGSEWCMFEFLIANPKTTKEQRQEATQLLFLELCKMAQNMGYKEIFTTSHLDTVSNELTKLGFIKSNIEVNHFIGRLI
jgi:hypothetical protein